MLPTDESFVLVFFVCFFSSSNRKGKNRTDHISVFGYQTTAARRVPDNKRRVLKGPNIQPVFRSLFFLPDRCGAASNDWLSETSWRSPEKSCCPWLKENTEARQNSDTLFGCLDGGINKAVVVDVSITLIHNWLIIVIPMLVLEWINSSIFRSVWVPFLTVQSFI